MTGLLTVRDLEAAFLAGAPDHAWEWLASAREKVAADRAELETLFPAAARACGRAPLADGWRTYDAARVLLLVSLPWRNPDPLAHLYTGGDADEKRAVLSALDFIEPDGRLLPIIEDALRTNDTRLITAALGRYGARHLAAPAYRHAILKCLFCGIPLAAVSGVGERADAELARMLSDFAAERVAAGRLIPEDVWPILTRFPQATRDQARKEWSR